MVFLSFIVRFRKYHRTFSSNFVAENLLCFPDFDVFLSLHGIESTVFIINTYIVYRYMIVHALLTIDTVIDTCELVYT